MAAYTQANGPMAITTPLGPDVLFLMRLEAREAVSELFFFRLDLLALKETKIAFESIIGASVTIEIWLHDGGKRFFNGIVSRFTQHDRDDTFTHFQAEVVPRLWLWTKRSQSRIYQHLSVPQILEDVFTGLDVKFELSEPYEPRDYCVQYRESDFAFASRVMEDEGIHYFFRHTKDGHQLIVSDEAIVHPELPQDSEVIYGMVSEAPRGARRVTAWQKTQELRSGMYTLWDHCFQLPGTNLEARQTALGEVQVGTVTHRLGVGGNHTLEIYDYPGGYADRFDGIDPAGGERPQELEKIFTDNERTVKIRAEQEETSALEIQGTSACPHFIPGYQFTLVRHFDADGPYLLTRVEHHARCADLRSTGSSLFEYENHFACIPAALPYRPRRVTRKPTTGGSQTATVVGPQGQEIFCDKYGRVKVQFHWDRQGKKNADSSCWIRIAQPWASGGFGAVAIPRVGDEVVVDFLEGDPDQPIILGSVYNARKPPPFRLPQNRMFTGIKSTSVRGTPTANFSGLSFNDTPGGERVALYAEKDMMVNSEHDHKHHVGHNQHVQIANISLMTVGGIPGGGGSGGGGGAETSATGDGDPSFGNWKTSNGLLSAQPGLAGSVIYGVNSQDTMGFMHQITVGGAYQLCFDPFSPAWGFLPNVVLGNAPVLPGLGAIFAGNLQLCYGTNTQAAYGPSISITHGPQVSVTCEPSTRTKVLGTLVPLVSLAYQAAFAAMYGRDDNADTRADLFAASVLAIRAATYALLASEKADQATFDLAQLNIKKKEADAQTAKALGIAGSSLFADFMKKTAPDMSVNKQKIGPEIPLTPLDDPHSIERVDGVSLLLAKHIHMIASKDPTKPDPVPSIVYINAAGKGDDGVVFINGSKGVTLTSQPAEMIELSENSIRIEGGPLGKVRIGCGPPVGGPEIRLDPAQGITMMCGPNKIAITNTGVTIDALTITLQAKLKHETKAMLLKKQVTLGDLQITLAKHL
jgi:type VI secretion system secreted protein VgrG